MKRCLVVFAILGMLIWWSSAAGQEDKEYDRARIKINYWTAEYTGDIEVEDEDVLGGTKVVIGEEVDLEDDLDIDNPRGIPEVEAELRLGQRHRLIAGYFATEYHGKKTLGQNLEVAGYTFLANTRLKTDFESERYKFMYEYRAIERDNASLGIMAGVEYYNLKVSYEGAANKGGVGTRVDDSNDLEAPIPVLGLRGRLHNDYGLGIYCDLAGMGASVEDVDASYLDLDAGLYYEYKRLYTSLGYRLIDSRLDADLSGDEKIEAHNSHQGWLASLGVNF